MKTYPFETLFKLTLDQQLQFITDNEIFDFESDLSINEIYEIFDGDKLDQNCKSLFDIIGDDSFTPNKKYLEYLYEGFLTEIKHYETGEKLGQTEQWFHYKFKKETAFSLNKKDALKIALKLKKKAIKLLKKRRPLFIPFHCSDMSELKDFFYEFWFADGSYLPADESINQDVLSFAFSGIKHNEYFDYAQLRNFSDWVEVVSTLRSIKFLDEIIVDCIKVNSFDRYKSSPYSSLFLDEVYYQLFILCINSDPKSTKRKFSMYYEIFHSYGFMYKHQGSMLDFISFVKKEFGETITRVENELSTDNTFELGNFLEKKDLIIK